MTHLLINYYEAASVILFGIGFMNLLLQNNLIKKFIGLNIMATTFVWSQRVHNKKADKNFSAIVLFS